MFLTTCVVRPASLQATSENVSAISAITARVAAILHRPQSRKHSSPVQRCSLLPVNPSRQDVEENRSRGIPLSKTINGHMAACERVVRAVPVVSLGGDRFAIERSKNFKEVVVDYGIH